MSAALQRLIDVQHTHTHREELSIMARLQHPHILRCFGGNLEVANPFIVTELCECSLDKVSGGWKGGRLVCHSVCIS